MQIKSEIRKQIISLRKTVSNEQRLEYSHRIAERLFDLRQYKEARQVFCYCSKENEISTEEIIRDLLNGGKKVALPVCDGDEMIFRFINSLDDLEKGSFGVYEPKSSCEAAICGKNTVCVTPALCFNEQGYRIGYGKGFYDKYFSKNPCIKIGLCCERFITDFEPDDNDISVDIVITESSLRYIGSKNKTQGNRKEK